MEPVLVIDKGNLSHSVAACLARSGHRVTVVSDDPENSERSINELLSESQELLPTPSPVGKTQVINDTAELGSFDLIIVISKDQEEEKREIIAKAGNHLSPNGTMAVNMLSVDLSEIQQGFNFSERIVGLNWVAPAHTTFFLEIIGNTTTNQEHLLRIKEKAASWGKDAYVLNSGFSVKARMAAALTREALYLVSNGYATPEDIDRNCRNDSGYYLPFAGNARYMDLMGTYAYGVVMKDLNQHLSKDSTLDQNSSDLLKNGHLGMQTGKGFFEYDDEEVAEWIQKMNTFSYKIHQVIKTFPFEEQ